MSQPPAKRRRIELSLEDKLKLIKESDTAPKPTIVALGKKFGIGKSTVGDIIKKKETYKEQWEKNADPKKQRFNSACKYDKLNDLTWEWFNQARGKNIPVSGVLIQEKATKFAQELELVDFKSSNGWLDRWKQRYSVKGFKITDESAGVPTESVSEFKERAKDIISGYRDEDIFNCDETGLFYRALSDKTLAVKGTSTSGTKMPKDRITVLFACSANGEKLKPLVIGKAQNPRCLKNIKSERLGVTYVAYQKAWMINAVFMDWLQTVNRNMRMQGRNILMFLDNAGSHGKDMSLSNVTLKFLPPNTTSHLQPLDQGIIRTFKAIYRKNLTRSLLSAIDSSEGAQKLCKKVTLLDAIGWTESAWKDVKVETIKKCFKNVGLSSSNDAELSDAEQEEDDDDVPLAVLARQLYMSAEDFQHIDDNLSTEDHSDEWEQSLVDSFCNSAASDPDEDSEEPEPKSLSDMSLSDVMSLVTQLKNFATDQDFDYMDIVLDLQKMTEKKLVKQK